MHLKFGVCCESDRPAAVWRVEEIKAGGRAEVDINTHSTYLDGLEPTGYCASAAVVSVPRLYTPQCSTTIHLFLFNQSWPTDYNLPLYSVRDCILSQ